MIRSKVVTFTKGMGTRPNLRINPQRRSLKGILVLFIAPYTAGARDSEKFCNPDITKVSVMVNGSPNRLDNNSIEGKDIWEEVSRFFLSGKKKMNKMQYMNVTKFYNDDKLVLLIIVCMGLEKSLKKRPPLEFSPVVFESY